MSGGTTSRGGFYFQDLVLAERLLVHLLAARKAEVEGGSQPPAPEFRIEAPGADGEAPDWDLVERRVNVVVLEEVKRGALSAEDRRILWRRARETLSTSDIDVGRVRVRLTVNGARPPEGVERWRALARVSQTAPASWPAHVGDGPHPAVRSDEDLASEAIHFLTDAGVDASRPLSEAQARLLLSQFELDDTRDPDGVEDAARALVEELTGEVGAIDVLRAIQGHLASRAASSDPARRKFTARDLVGSIELVAKLAVVDPGAVATWRELARRGGALLSAPEPAGGLSYQPWRRVQPRIADRLGRDASCVAVLGRGGQGKSVLLRRWLEEEGAQGAVALWLAATDLAAIPPAQLRAAIGLGAFAARRDGKRLAIALDALEALGTPNEQLTAAAALAFAARAGVAVSLSCRLVAWRTLPGSQESLAGWEALEMSEWSEELVREQVAASQRPNITADLVKLLRTPLLLDLFVRTFGRQEPVPPGVQSRHGLLRAYWERRVLPDADPRAADRRALLVRVAQEEARGVRAHDALGQAADDLTSEGLFSLLAGQRVFRHVLLRDFTMMMWALQASGAEVGTRLASVAARLPQFGALRATLEAACDTSGPSSGVSAGSIVAALSPELLSDAATVLGELEDARSVDLGALLAPMSEPSQESFLQSLLRAAKVAANPEALRQVTRLPSTEASAMGSAAIGVDSLLELAAFVHALLRAHRGALRAEDADGAPLRRGGPELRRDLGGSVRGLRPQHARRRSRRADARRRAPDRADRALAGRAGRRRADRDRGPRVRRRAVDLHLRREASGDEYDRDRPARADHVRDHGRRGRTLRRRLGRTHARRGRGARGARRRALVGAERLPRGELGRARGREARVDSSADEGRRARRPERAVGGRRRGDARRGARGRGRVCDGRCERPERGVHAPRDRDGAPRAASLTLPAAYEGSLP